MKWARIHTRKMHPRLTQSRNSLIIIPSPTKRCSLTIDLKTKRPTLKITEDRALQTIKMVIPTAKVLCQMIGLSMIKDMVRAISSSIVPLIDMRKTNIVISILPNIEWKRRRVYLCLAATSTNKIRTSLATTCLETRLAGLPKTSTRRELLTKDSQLVIKRDKMLFLMIDTLLVTSEGTASRKPA
jgi:hypothetical protein